ncbi:MAG: hypothetical protein QOC77_376 [Thermoleophilaceae bacterium]|jgi:hypothetical protein|nr:hypothetical protein [Thermoleophilaceae bacterium]
MLLIDTRRPPPDPPAKRAPWEPNWRLLGWVALAIAAGLAADATTGVVAYVLAMATLGCACRALCVVLPSLDGLRDYRQ